MALLVKACRGRNKWFRDWEIDKERIRSKTGIKLQRLSKKCIIYAWYPAWMSSSKAKKYQVLPLHSAGLTGSRAVCEKTKPRLHNALWHRHSEPVMHAAASLVCSGANSISFLSLCMCSMCAPTVYSNSKPTSHRGSIQLSWAMKSYITWLAMNMPKTSSC